MKKNLQERVQHDAPSFPFQLYSMDLQPGSHAVPLHWHQEIEIIHIVQGNLNLVLDGEEIMARGGEIFFINSGGLHGMGTKNGPVKYNAFLFAPQLLLFEQHDICRSQFVQPLCTGKACFPRRLAPGNRCYSTVCMALEVLAGRYGAQTPGWQLAARAALALVVSELAGDNLISFDPVKSASQQEERIKEMLQYLDENSSEPLRLDAVAARYGLSAKYFSRFFKKNMGRGFVDYMNTLRLEKAADWLMNTDDKVITVAMEVGFENYSYFIRCFKQHFGCTPAAFRKNGHEVALYTHTFYKISR